MIFSRLRVLGFKSFVEPTDFLIEQGLTGVVGPNGCGKSNLVEALRWVMGESSYKNMRGSGMDDVIFAGSNTRPARNTAEVTLFLDNTGRKAPPAYNAADEVQISRRIEREAGSVYRINGKEARAKDVQLIFADQSTGARSPSMVGQGRIGELIQAKPQARRALLEEAAGISGLHSRRHEAELRLRAAEQNLERLDDVVGQLQNQIESLRRQARQATRFRNLSADIRKGEATLLHLRWSQEREQEAEAKSALASATALVGERAALQMNTAKKQAVGANRLPELREAEASATAALQRLSIAKEHLEEEARRVEARREELSRRAQQLESDIGREEQILADTAGVLRRLTDEEESLRNDDLASKDREVEAHTALHEASLALTGGEEALSQVTVRRADAVARRGQAERELAQSTERLERLQRQLADIGKENSVIAERMGALPNPSEKKALLESAQVKLQEAEDGYERARVEVIGGRTQESDASAMLQEARSELARIETEANTLQKVLAGLSGGRFSPILEEVKVDNGYEAALGAALADDLDLPTDAEAPAHWAVVEAGSDDPALPAGVVPLVSLVRGPAQMARRLAQTGLVENDEQGAALQSSLKTGQMLVSRQGAVWRWDGYRAREDAPTPAAQRLAQKNRLSELYEQAQAAERKVTAVEEWRAQADEVLKRALEAEKHAREAIRTVQRKVEEAREGLAKAEKAAGELTSRRAVLAQSHAHIGQSLQEATNAHEKAATALADGPDLSGIEAEHDRQAAKVAELRAAMADARSSHDGVRRDAEFRRKRLAAIGEERGSWKKRADNGEGQVAALKERYEEAIREIEGLADAPEAVSEQRRTLLSQLSQAEKLRQAAADKLQVAENAQIMLDKDANAATQALSEAREQRGRAEERLTAADERRKEIELRIKDALSVPPNLVFRQTGMDDDEDLPEIGDVEKRLERLRMERERLGAVNLRAEEEQRELSERLETLVSERADIIEAIAKLRHAIQNLNREGRERLLAAFGRVNEQFRRLFTHLFGGGTAELQLVESDDPLEAGLEILARPPGKKPQTMTLLSGGEQALTAMALIFAVFLTNPAPICVLDEVDAPLDDHNVERFCNLMDEMAASTQTRFIIITHNPITMARMDRLFGVTMAEQGVSQLVSVDLQTAEQIREAV